MPEVPIPLPESRRSETNGPGIGEEAVETLIAAVDGNDERFLYEAFRYALSLMVLLTSKAIGWNIWPVN